jgi:hypothetical protein
MLLSHTAVAISRPGLSGECRGQLDLASSAAPWSFDIEVIRTPLRILAVDAVITLS